MSSFGAADVRVGEALARIRAHHGVALELLRMGRRADALLQATRPITGILPWLANELRGYGTLVSELTAVLARSASTVRQGADEREIRRAFRRAALVTHRGTKMVVGAGSRTQGYGASVVVALLSRAAELYQAAVGTGDLARYQEAHALVHCAARMYEELTPKDDDASSSFAVLLDAFPLPVAPLEPAPAPRVDAAVARVKKALAGSLGALTDLREKPPETIARLDRLLEDVSTAYASGTRPVAARLASEVCLRGYVPLREDLAQRAPDVERELTELLGVELRRAINEGVDRAEVSGTVARARYLLAAAEGALRAKER